MRAPRLIGRQRERGFALFSVDAICLAPSRVLRLASASAAIDAAAAAAATAAARPSPARVPACGIEPTARFTRRSRSRTRSGSLYGPTTSNEVNFLTGARGIPPQKAPRCTAKLVPGS